jgi:hypothetical protein
MLRMSLLVGQPPIALWAGVMQVGKLGT